MLEIVFLSFGLYVKNCDKLLILLIINYWQKLFQSKENDFHEILFLFFPLLLFSISRIAD
jgi:hypothetical protein